MYAAARFSDLPELRDLRQAFQERYGNSFDHFVNQEVICYVMVLRWIVLWYHLMSQLTMRKFIQFAERMAAKPSTMEKKVKLMQDIASEYSISWDAKAFMQRMSRPPSILPVDWCLSSLMCIPSFWACIEKYWLLTFLIWIWLESVRASFYGYCLFNCDHLFFPV